MWVAEANMLYLESPIGVGFSYSTDTSSYEGVNDKITGKFSIFILLFDLRMILNFIPLNGQAPFDSNIFMLLKINLFVSLSLFFFSCTLYLLLNYVMSLSPKVLHSIMLLHYLLFYFKVMYVMSTA